ncbi:MAG: hypothetical protein H6741_26655 [Alphaproteobacteria bacterium]|nr:hypothetical protein [Alphaproteobacteria bacterium]
MPTSIERAKALLTLLDEGDRLGAEAKAETLWATDREAFWWLLTEQVARGRHSLELGVVLLRAVLALPRPEPDALRRVFTLTVQRLVPERPCAEARELLDCAERLMGVEAYTAPPPWLLLGAAVAQIHHLHYLVRHDQDADLAETLRGVHARLSQAAEVPKSAREHLQLAAALGQYAALTGDGRWLGTARASLEATAEVYPQIAAQWSTFILIQFAKALSREDLWHEVVELSQAMLQEVEPAELEELVRFKRRQEVTHYNLAVTYGFLGQRALGLSHLAEAVVLNRRRMHLAVCDDDMGPLLSGAGSSDFSFVLSTEKH